MHGRRGRGREKKKKEKGTSYPAFALSRVFVLTAWPSLKEERGRKEIL